LELDNFIRFVDRGPPHGLYGTVHS
jgi:hypothetical protein